MSEDQSPYQSRPPANQLDRQASMSPEAQLIAIAEACGWTKAFSNSFYGPCGFPPGVSIYPMEKIPDYLNSFDACAEFEATLKGTALALGYAHTLALVTGSTHDCIFATPAQRCRAFLIVKGLWKP